MARSSTTLDCSDHGSECRHAEYDRTIHDAVLQALSDITTAGAFAACGSLYPVGPVDPGLHVEGVGDIELPLSHEAAGSLIKLSRQAPYGDGKQTVVNTEVRKTWEIDAAKVCFTNAWDGYLNEAIRHAKLQMGLRPDLK